MAEAPPAYPADLNVDYPERLSRLTTFFRPIVAIPILIVLGLLLSQPGADSRGAQAEASYGGVGFVVLPVLLLLLFRRKYPRWWYDWNVALTSFALRVSAYLLLLRDEYPSTDEEQAVHLYLPYPDAREDLNRWLPLVKWLLAIPHYIVLFILFFVVAIVTIVSWFAILFTASYPRGLFDVVVGFLRWSVRVAAYAFLLTTDRYPPFSLQ